MSDMLKAIQIAVGTTPDGIFGPKTEAAIAQKLNVFPALLQSKIRSGNTVFGKPGDESYLVNVPVPEGYPLKYEGKPVSTVRVHYLIASKVQAILQDTINHYGTDIATVAPGLCVYSGSYNNRSVSNGSKKSMHAWGLALDFDAEANAYAFDHTKARLARPEYQAFWEIVASHGAFSLGKHADCDWMHFQFAAFD